MSKLSTFVQNLRTNVKIEQEKKNAQAKVSASRVMGIPMALGLAFMVMMIFQPVSAGNLSDAVSPILNDVADLFTPLLNLVIAAVPLIISLAIIGFVLGIFTAILLKLKL
jgi:ABC-type phosphate/phosphonate transport system permease subunit